MHLYKAICCAAAIAVMTVFVAPNARADEWNKRTYLTFSGPVQIPGATLPAGTYLFQLADPDNARHVVMVASKDGTKVYGMFITIPNDRLDTPDNNVVMFGESPAGTAQAIQAWWYPGDRTGEEFVYPKNQAMRIAKANHREVLATDSDVNASGSESARLNALRGSNVGRVNENGAMNSSTAAANTAESVNKNSAPAATTTTAKATTTAPANTVDGQTASKSKRRAANTTTVGTTGQAKTTTAANQSRRANLPQTASDLALFELLSGLSLAGAFSVRRLRQRSAEAR